MGIGIGIVTYNRLDLVKQAVSAVLKYTSEPYFLVVADDGSTDGTREFLTDQNITVVGDRNRGIAWNKNRALYTLRNHADVDTIILLEDDTVPVKFGWQDEWRRAVAKYGYVTYAHPKIMYAVLTGTGTPDDAFGSTKITSQCSAVSREALDKVGYFDTRFRGYGVEDGEWSMRFKNEGYGVVPVKTEDSTLKTNCMISGGVRTLVAATYRDDESVRRNRDVFELIRNDPIPRSAWRSEEEKAVLIGDIENSLRAVPLVRRRGADDVERDLPLDPAIRNERVEAASEQTASIGIGIVTYNRLALVKQAVSAVRKYTSEPYFLVVADDGSTDGTREFLAEQKITVVGDRNRGIAWNKNRALYALRNHTNVDTIILLEDDTVPVKLGWQDEWRRAVAEYGYVAHAHPKVMASVVSGSGTAEDPFACTKITSQCSAVSTKALDAIGYFDTRFQGYGFEDGEWVTRLRSAGFGIVWLRSQQPKANCMIDGGVRTLPSVSFRNGESVLRNGKLFDLIRNDPIPRRAWRSEEEKAALLGDVENSLRAAPLLPRLSAIESREGSPEQLDRKSTDAREESGSTKLHRKAKVLYRNGVTAEQEGRYEEAASYFSEAIRLDANHTYAQKRYQRLKRQHFS